MHPTEERKKESLREKTDRLIDLIFRADETFCSIKGKLFGAFPVAESKKLEVRDEAPNVDSFLTESISKMENHLKMLIDTDSRI